MGWPVSKQAAYHGLFQNGPNKKLLLIGLTGVKMGWPVLKWAARFKMGQITNRAVTYILYNKFGTVSYSTKFTYLYDKFVNLAPQNSSESY